ncbi:efflux transporter outer membrane subunit [Novacetimonas hansenii]|uniref:Efflux transporter outer membrane subunit n=2 Tax=Novacetimonas hansenii TaxID=436 RepID=A0AAW5ENG5_NOVHA|nr:efflux transporter outer membrane subunit [Novacetimonas hansenii]MCJ8353274.1 efflux transporter outer membrane subunit [Novacetimonas hansenii]PYD74154.1 secretion protein [Novacetimonas hansenii]GAN83590.1 secretion system type I outer membrane efflux pump lipoprotein NodT [Novacetimonas hansenii JCM 7643]GBQ54905.1 secretion system type I outer membrane efflux pump lipoprotein NodT [Novacetimonas hansenii NRIC 0243]GEC62886.1 RND transporter [Novacetimonas hansenii]
MMKSGLRRCTAMRGVGLASMLMLAGCDLAPAYHAPHYVIPTTWQGQAPFAPAHPMDDSVRAEWWKAFTDPRLDELEAEATAHNGNLQAAAERFLQARSVVSEARSDLLPHFGLAFGGSNNKSSAERLFRYKGPITDSDEFYGGMASWEPDFWSSIRNRVRLQKDYAQEQAAEYASARLSLQAELASDYFTLRGLDAQANIYTQSIRYYEDSLRVTRTRLQDQAASRLDVARAENQLYTTQAHLLDIQAQREVMEHAIAVLVNVAPSSFHLAPDSHLNTNRVALSPGVPSELLERRPDIAMAERQMAQANRAIGIARAAFYPHVSFRMDGGFDDNGFNLANLANSMWTYGATVTLPIFEGGLRRAQLQQSWSAYRETRDHYRMTVLTAFRDVEDGLSRTKRLDDENARLRAAVGAASQTQDITMNLYKGGLAAYLDVLIAQVSTLEARIQQVEVQTRYLQAQVGLIRACGGGWNASLLPASNRLSSVGALQYSGLHPAQPVGDVPVPRTKGEDPEDNLTGPKLSALSVR